MELMSLLIRLNISGDGQVTTSLRRVQQEAKRTEETAKSMSSVLGGAFDSVLGKIGRIQSISYGLASIGQTLATLTGTRAAAEIGSVNRQLEIITGSSDKARSAIKKLLDTSRSSPFETKDVLQFGRGLIDQYGAEVGTRRADRLVRLYQGLGGTSGEFGNYQRNVQQIGTRGSKQVEADDVQSLLDSIPIVTLASRKMGLSLDEANRKLRTMSGNDLLGFLESLGKDMKSQRPQDVFGAATQAAKTFAEAMAPTGAIINSTLTPFLNKVAEGIGIFGRLNELSGGKAGLALVFGAAAIGVRLFTRALAEATMGLRGLGVLGLIGSGGGAVATKVAAQEAAEAVAREGAKGAVTGGAGATARGAGHALLPSISTRLMQATDKAVGGMLGNIGKSLGWSTLTTGEKLRRVLLPRNIAEAGQTFGLLRGHLTYRIGHILGRTGLDALSALGQGTASSAASGAAQGGIRAFLTGAVKSILSPINLIPMLADLGLSTAGGYITGNGNPKLGKTLSGVGSGIGWGALAGTILGGILGTLVGPGAGTAAGAVLGAKIGTVAGGSLGALIGGIRGYRGGSEDEKAEKAKTVADQQLAESKKQTKFLENISLQMVGGGNRSRSAGDILAIEYAMYNAAWRNSVF